MWHKSSGQLVGSKFIIFISNKWSRVWIGYFTRLCIIISSTWFIFCVNLDDFFAVVCTGFHEDRDFHQIRSHFIYSRPSHLNGRRLMWKIEKLKSFTGLRWMEPGRPYQNLKHMGRIKQSRHSPNLLYQSNLQNKMMEITTHSLYHKKYSHFNFLLMCTKISRITCILGRKKYLSTKSHT